ncbi:unnamed protein product, partial [Sphenostylis stenocarpa]
MNSTSAVDLHNIGIHRVTHHFVIGTCPHQNQGRCRNTIRVGHQKLGSQKQWHDDDMHLHRACRGGGKGRRDDSIKNRNFE